MSPDDKEETDHAPPPPPEPPPVPPGTPRYRFEEGKDGKPGRWLRVDNEGQEE